MELTSPWQPSADPCMSSRGRTSVAPHSRSANQTTLYEILGSLPTSGSLPLIHILYNRRAYVILVRYVRTFLRSSKQCGGLIWAIFVVNVRPKSSIDDVQSLDNISKLHTGVHL